MQTLDIALVGLGSVGLNFLKIVEQKQTTLKEKYGLKFRICCVADSSGVAINEKGFNLLKICEHKQSGKKVRDLPGLCENKSVSQVLEEINCDFLLEASSANPLSKEVSLSACIASLNNKTHVVLANKAPLVMEFERLRDLARENGVGLLYSAAFCGGLPVLNMGCRDMIAGQLTYFQGVFNSTTNFILESMSQGRTFSDALLEAQERGIAEADASLDVDGWDTANKLVIAANSFFEEIIKISDVDVQGISEVTINDLRKCQLEGNTIKLIASIELECGSKSYSVRPTVVSNESFLATCRGWEMGVEMHSDIYGKVCSKLWEREPIPTAASMIRDIIHLAKLGREGTFLG